MMKEKLNPWESTDISDYDKLIQNFGIKPMQKYCSKLDDFHLIRRGIIFGHRDFEKIFSHITSGKKYVLMTGLMPSGRFHLGHKMVADEIKYFQTKGAKIFVCAADIESYLMRGIPLAEARQTAVEEYLTNYLASGISMENLTFWFQSDYITPYYLLRDMLARRPTFNELKAIYGQLSTEKIISSLTQAADILHPQLPGLGGKRPVLVPCGADQDPHIRLTRDIAKRETEYDFTPPAAVYHKFMKGLTGGKMSSSDPKSYVALLEEPEVAAKKIMSAKTGGRESLDLQKKEGGKPNECVVYELCLYHLTLDDLELSRVYHECVEGKRLCGECKKQCADSLKKYLKQHQRKAGKVRGLAEEIASKKRC
ncbi:MAG: tryptophan--tRNA ligase [Candidatus Altiarchaeales archaeon]|nr:tryptophan--tRNA ligase [Candidatus Altiarchaeales archaeon]